MVVATFSKYSKQNLMIAIVVCIGAIIVCIHDGYYNQDFINKHTIDDQIDSVLAFNKYSPPVFAVFAILAAIRYYVVGSYKVVADKEAIEIDGKLTIKYDDIESLNKTYFDVKGKGYFILKYKSSDGSLKDLKISKKRYDGTSELLETIVSKIS